MPKLDLDSPAMPTRSGSDYPPPFDAPVRARFIVVGANTGGTTYPDIDLLHVAGEQGYRHKDGTPY